jgi:hypothetical protein
MSYPNRQYVLTDRTGETEIVVGQRLRIQHCVGRYGETRIHEGVAETIDRIRGVTLRLDEHGHEAWIEVLEPAA